MAAILFDQGQRRRGREMRNKGRADPRPSTLDPTGHPITQGQRRIDSSRSTIVIAGSMLAATLAKQMAYHNARRNLPG
eukprot:2394482-Rhodomonas_salina.2